MDTRRRMTQYHLMALVILSIVVVSCTSDHHERGRLAGPGITIDIEPYPIGETEPGIVIWEA